MIFTRPAGAVMIFTRSRNAAASDNSMYCMIPDPFPSLVPRPLYARSARWERDKGLVPVVRACVEFYWNPGKIVFFGIF